MDTRKHILDWFSNLTDEHFKLILKPFYQLFIPIQQQILQGYPPFDNVQFIKYLEKWLFEFEDIITFSRSLHVISIVDFLLSETFLEYNLEVAESLAIEHYRETKSPVAERAIGNNFEVAKKLFAEMQVSWRLLHNTCLREQDLTDFYHRVSR